MESFLSPNLRFSDPPHLLVHRSGLLDMDMDSISTGTMEDIVFWSTQLSLMLFQTMTLLRRVRRARRNLQFLMASLVRNRRRTVQWLRHQSTRAVALHFVFKNWCRVARPRRYWVCPRTDDWWKNFVSGVWDDEKWVQHFRMSRATFQEIVEELLPVLQRKATHMREPVSVQKRVAITIWWLATSAAYRTVAEQFGVGKATVANTVVEVCLAMEWKLFPRVVRFQDPQTVMAGFAALGFPNCVGAVDGTHIRVISPAHQGRDSVKRKKYFSVLLQATVDSKGYIWNCEVGFSGKMHDAHVLRSTVLYPAMDAGELIPGNPTLNVNGMQVPPLIVAGGAYPIRPWLMKPYTGVLTPKQQHYNHNLSRARAVVGCAFGRLKSRWRRIWGVLEVAEENINAVIISCIVLHNLCELKGHLTEECTPPPLITLDDSQLLDIENDRKKKTEGMAVREAIAEFLWEGREREEPKIESDPICIAKGDP